MTGTPLQGTLIWFNVEKGYGFIRTAEGDRLRVSQTGFQEGCEPPGRCAGHEVLFDLGAGDGEAEAVNVRFPSAAPPRRARLRHSR